jgi:hypothetical protein
MTSGAKRLALAAAVAVAVASTGCGNDDNDVASTTDATAAPAATTAATFPPETTTSATATTAVIVVPDGSLYDPTIDPADFVAAIDNPYLPLTAGSRWVYEGIVAGGLERTEVVVTDQTRTVMGVAVTVVRDTVSVDGEVVEDTYDWYAQDRDGNVWYFGEDVKSFDAGQLTDTDGSWEAGADGALPGIVMLAEPAVGQAYRQEYYEDEAEDLGEVIAVGGSQVVPAGSYDHVITTRDWNPLEPDVVEEKQYAPGVGLIREARVVGGDEEATLVELTR